MLNRSSASVFGVSEDERSMGYPGPFTDVGSAEVGRSAAGQSRSLGDSARMRR